MPYDILTIERLLAVAQTTPDFDIGAAKTMTDTQIAEAYNGAGPDRWPQSVRDLITDYINLYAPAVLVHDCDFTVSDYTEEGLEKATERFRANTKAIFRNTYPFWCWKTFTDSEYRKERGKALALKLGLDIAVSPSLCRQAWQEAYKSSNPFVENGEDTASGREEKQ